MENGGKLPYETLVLVCTHQRGPDEKVSCAGHGRCGATLRDQLKEEVAKRGLKSKIRVSASGCLDVCAEGPNLVVIGPDGGRKWLKKVSESDVPAIIEGLTKGS
jgi:(2Fe-2S) ferredoxin